MGDVIYVDFRNKSKYKDRHGAESDNELQRRLNNIDGSVKRLNALIKELKNTDNQMTGEELDKFLDDIHTRR